VSHQPKTVEGLSTSLAPRQPMRDCELGRRAGSSRGHRKITRFRDDEVGKEEGARAGRLVVTENVVTAAGERDGEIKGMCLSKPAELSGAPTKRRLGQLIGLICRSLKAAVGRASRADK